MRRPHIKEAQKLKFKQEFSKLLAEAPIELKDWWDGDVHWINDIPLIQKITNKLPPKLADKYAVLIDKVKDRSI